MQAVSEVTELSEHILATLRDNGDWMTRRELGLAIGRPVRLTPYDLELIEGMAKQGLIEIAKRPAGPVRMEYVYRSVGQGNE